MHQARAFKDPIVAEFIDEEDLRLYNLWKDAGDTTKREELHLQCLGLERFRKFIRKTIIDGEQAEQDLAKQYDSN